MSRRPPPGRSGARSGAPAAPAAAPLPARHGPSVLRGAPDLGQGPAPGQARADLRLRTRGGPYGEAVSRGGGPYRPRHLDARDRPAARGQQVGWPDFARQAVLASTCGPKRPQAAVARSRATTRAAAPGAVNRTLTSPGPRQVSARTQDHTARPARSGRGCPAKSHTSTARTPSGRPARWQAVRAQLASAAVPVASRGWWAGAAPPGRGVWVRWAGTRPPRSVTRKVSCSSMRAEERSWSAGQEAHGPDVEGLDVAEPDASGPDVAEPDAPGPDAAGPDAAGLGSGSVMPSVETRTGRAGTSGRSRSRVAEAAIHGAVR